MLITREPKRISEDFTALSEAIHTAHPRYKVVLLQHRKLRPSYAVHALQEMYHLATCQACLVDGYIIPVSVLSHRPGLPVGQIWHALGAVKKFGHATSGMAEGTDPTVAAVMQMHQNYTFITASGDVPAEIYGEAFGVDRTKIEPLGMPRVDSILNPAVRERRRRAVLRAFPQLAEGKVVLYAPTFRRGHQVHYHQLCEAFPHGENHLVVLPHPSDRSALPQEAPMIIGDSFGPLDWLSVADVVITDYSAITYEAVLHDIPLVFWPYDLDLYEEARGLALDYAAEMPGPVVTSAERAVSEAISASEVDYRAFRARHLNYITDDEGNLPETPPRCTQRIVERLNLTEESPSHSRSDTIHAPQNHPRELNEAVDHCPQGHHHSG